MVILDDVFYTLNKKPAASFEGLVWFAVSCQDLFANTIQPGRFELIGKKTG